MAPTRLTGDVRKKQLKLAISRIKRGRAHTKHTRLSIAAVAREAGVSTALIHNCYPDIAEIVREAQGRSSRAQRDAKHFELKQEVAKNLELRAELRECRLMIAKLATINEMLTIDNQRLTARVEATNVSDMPIGRTNKT